MANSDLNCWYINASSLTNKLDELTLLVFQSAPDIIFITETKFDGRKPTNKTETELDGYICFRKDYKKDSVGVCIYVRIHGKMSFSKDNYKIELNDSIVMEIKQMACVCLFEGNENLIECEHGNVEQVWCSLTIKKGDQSETFLLGCIYRHPDKKTDEAINQIINQSGKRCFLNKLPKKSDSLIAKIIHSKIRWHYREQSNRWDNQSINEKKRNQWNNSSR